MANAMLKLPLNRIILINIRKYVKHKNKYGNNTNDKNKKRSENGRKIFQL